MRKHSARAILPGHGLCLGWHCAPSPPAGVKVAAARPGTFQPSGSMAGQASARRRAATAAGSVTMPGLSVRTCNIDLTTWAPSSASQAQAVLTDKNYELAFLYAEYTGGQDTAWTSYVSSTMQTEAPGHVVPGRRDQRVVHRQRSGSST